MTKDQTTHLATFLKAALAGSPYSIEQIAERMGYPNPGIILMFADGEARVPFDRVRPLAEAIGCSVEGLMIATLRSALPENVMADIELGVLSDQLGSPAAEYIRCIKAVTGGILPEITPNIRRRLRIAFGKL